MPKRTIPEKWLQSASDHHTSRFVIASKEEEGSPNLVERYLGKVRLKKPTPKR
jgi:hypothetical protein